MELAGLGSEGPADRSEPRSATHGAEPGWARSRAEPGRARCQAGCRSDHIQDGLRGAIGPGIGYPPSLMSTESVATESQLVESN
jgi:hypothetical protein